MPHPEKPWPVANLEELTADGESITYGVVKPGEEDLGGVAFIRGGDIANGRILSDQLRTISPIVSAQYRRTLLRGGELLVSLVGNPGQVALVPPAMAGANIARQVGLVRLRPSIDAQFALYYLSSPMGQSALGAQSLGSVQQVINLRDLKRVEIPLPPLNEQRAIAAVLGSLDDQIEQNRRTGAKLEGLARAVFKAWFVDFEPVKAKAAGATAFPGMPPAAFVALPDRLTDSFLGPIPQEWGLKTVGDAATLSKQQLQPQDHADESFEHFSIPAYDAGQNPVVEPGSGIKSQKFVVAPGCVLLSKLNPRIPRVWLPSLANARRQIASTEFLVVIPSPGWTREFFYCLFQQGDFRDSLTQSASGTSNSHQRVRPNDLLDRPLVVPPKPILDAFAEMVIPQFALREALHAESSKLAALRDYLLPRLLSGRVRVRDAETLLERSR